MALLPKFPLHKPISFLPQTRYVQEGQPHVVDRVTCNHYWTVQQPIWERLAEERLRVVEAKQKFSDTNTKELQKRWKWDEVTINSYRLQFRVIDLNEDGLIDFKELCHTLDAIGDMSSEEERRSYFQELDTDQSNGVDFEEFLELIDKVQSGFAGSIGKVCVSTRSEVQDIIRIGQLSLSQQIQHRLF